MKSNFFVIVSPHQEPVLNSTFLRLIHIGTAHNQFGNFTGTQAYAAPEDMNHLELVEK